MSYTNLENIFVIGDVHGCYYTLQNLIKQFPKNSELIFVGDLCDKGNYSKEVIEFVINNNYQCVKGNHEHHYEKHIINAVKHNIKSRWSSDKRYGGLQCIKSYNDDLETITKHLQWIKKLPFYLEIDEYFITHGFGLEYYSFKNNPDYHNDFLTNRVYLDTKEPSIKENIINIFGHCVFDEVQIGNKYICLDTGCSKGGKLSAIQLGTKKIYQEQMDPRDSTYVVKELMLKDIELKSFDLEHINKITFKDNCRYKGYDIVSTEVLEYIKKTFPKESKKEILSMQMRDIIFPKQLKKLFL